MQAGAGCLQIPCGTCRLAVDGVVLFCGYAIVSLVRIVIHCERLARLSIGTVERSGMSVERVFIRLEYDGAIENGGDSRKLMIGGHVPKLEASLPFRLPVTVQVEE